MLNNHASKGGPLDIPISLRQGYGRQTEIKDDFCLSPTSLKLRGVSQKVAQPYFVVRNYEGNLKNTKNDFLISGSQIKSGMTREDMSKIQFKNFMMTKIQNNLG